MVHMSNSQTISVQAPSWGRLVTTSVAHNKKNDLWNSQSQGQLLITSEAAVQVFLNGKKNEA